MGAPAAQATSAGPTYAYTPAGRLASRIWARGTTTTGLYHYTTTTNQVIEGGTMVDIGFHYVALNASGNPLDSNGDGIPDYLSDLNGNGADDPNETPWDLAILAQPLSQTVDEGDTVTFAVVADGIQPITYQWYLGTQKMVGSNASSITFTADIGSQQGNTYSVQVGDALGNPITSSNAILAINDPAYWPLVTLTGPRQNYTFMSGATYYVGSQVQLYGPTTIQGGAVIKFDPSSSLSSLAIAGTLACQAADPYQAIFLTSALDETVGDFWEPGNPAPSGSGAPYIDLTADQDAAPSLSNLHVRYANVAVASSPSKRVDVWDSQFVQCNSAVAGAAGATVVFHNALFAGCGAVSTSQVAFAAINCEHVTADVSSFWTNAAPGQINLTNSIVMPTLGSGPTVRTYSSAIHPAPPVFQSAGAGSYYLPGNSPYRAAGTTRVSPALLQEFTHKTTQPPIPLPTFSQVAGQLTLAPQAQRYTNGPPDYGYYYPALDYTVAWLTNWGAITVLRGTAVGFRNEYWESLGGVWTCWGFDLREGSSFVAQGTPDKPVVLADVGLVQDQPTNPCYASFVPDFWPADPSAPFAPSMSFRFSNFYATPGYFHVWSGYDAYWDGMSSPDSLLNWTMRDCSVHGGSITLGHPDNGLTYNNPNITAQTIYGRCSVDWTNNLFENVAIDLDPTFYEVPWINVINCDMAFQAAFNLFRGAPWFHLEPIPATAGDWAFTNNVFDQVDLLQNPTSPLAFDYNAYWPLTAGQLASADNYFVLFGWFEANESRLSATGYGVNDQVLPSPLQYQTGPFGNYYLPSATPLSGTGSGSPAYWGLCQYTTQTNQTKEINSPSVSKGLHYVAANAQGGPLDTDFDGIPDYVEDANGNGIVDANETSPVLASTVNGMPDASNSVYLDIDLSGDGLVGRIKAALGMLPLDPSNPLTLQQVPSGQEPDIVTFQVPVNFTTLTNIGVLNLNLNGVDVEFEDCGPTNAVSLVTWNTTYEAPGQGLLQPQLTIWGVGVDTAILAALGTVMPFDSTNVVQFFAGDGLFDASGAHLDAQLPPQYANQTVTYSIQLNDPSAPVQPAPLATISGSTSSGVILADWIGLLESDGQTTFAGDTFTATFNVTFPGSASGHNTATLSRIVANEQPAPGLFEGFDFAYMYDTDQPQLWPDFGYNGGNLGKIWLAMLGPVDTLLSPQTVSGGNPDCYYSLFDIYDICPVLPTGYPGFCASQTDITKPGTGLYATMAPTNAAIATKNFYCYAHGSGVGMASYSGLTYIRSCDVANVLGNHYYGRGKFQPSDPYRFVFLDGCSTESKHWRRAFGILPIWALRPTIGPQAFVGWDGGNLDWLGAITMQTERLATMGASPWPRLTPGRFPRSTNAS